jgi:hypothetical protein
VGGDRVQVRLTQLGDDRRECVYRGLGCIDITGGEDDLDVGTQQRGAGERVLGLLLRSADGGRGQIGSSLRQRK